MELLHINMRERLLIFHSSVNKRDEETEDSHREGVF